MLSPLVKQNHFDCDAENRLKVDWTKKQARQNMTMVEPGGVFKVLDSRCFLEGFVCFSFFGHTQ